MKFWAVVPAAGAGTRFSTQVQKQFLTYQGQFIFTLGLKTLLEHPDIAGVVLTTQDIPTMPEAAYTHWLEFQSRFKDKLRLTAGGSERVWSVRAGVKALLQQQDWVVNEYDQVLVHDGVRPCLHHEDVCALIKVLQKVKCDSQSPPIGAMLGKPVADTLKRVKNGALVAHVDRSDLWQAQTPQGFPLAMLEHALDQCFYQVVNKQSTGVPTDECQIMAEHGVQIKAVHAQYPNPKLTYGDDLPLILQLIEQRYSSQVNV